MNLKKYYGSLSQWFCYEIEYPLPNTEFAQEKLTAHYHVQLTWTGSKYKVSNALIRVFHPDENCHIEDWPFRKTSTRWGEICDFLEETPTADELFNEELYALAESRGELE